MLEAANARPRFTISLKRCTQNLLLSTSSLADYPIFRIGRIGVINNQDETFSAVGDTLPRKWRGDIFGLAGVPRGNVTILLERG
jgi:hypothetical protein